MIPVVAHSVNPYLPNSGSSDLPPDPLSLTLSPYCPHQANGPPRTSSAISPIYSVKGQPFLRAGTGESVRPGRGVPHSAPIRTRCGGKMRRRCIPHFADMAIRNIPLVKEAAIPDVASFDGSDIWARARDRRFREASVSRLGFLPSFSWKGRQWRTRSSTWARRDVS